VIEHIVLFMVRSGAEPDQIERMLDGLRSLKTVVPGIRELTCGANFSNRSRGFTHGLYIRFESRADMEAYSAHPEHQRVVTERIRPIVDDLLALDYEVPR